MINIQCPHCQAAIRCDDRYASRVVACPSCKKQVKLPAIARALPAKRAQPQAPSPRPQLTSAIQPAPSSADQQDLSWMSGESKGTSSHRLGSPISVSRKKKKTNPTPYIVAGGSLLLIAMVGIASLALRSSRDKPTLVSSSASQTSTTKDNNPERTGDDLEASRVHISETEQHLLAQKQKNAVMARLTSSFDAQITALSRKQAEEFDPVKKELLRLYAVIASSPNEQAKLQPRIRQLEDRFQKISAELDSGWSQLGKEMTNAQGIFPNQDHSQEQSTHTPQVSSDADRAERDNLLAEIEQRKRDIELTFLNECSAEYDQIKRRMTAVRADPNFGDIVSSSGRRNYTDMNDLIRQGNELQKGAPGNSPPAEKRRQGLAILEQERRQILARYPVSGDPQYIAQQGMLLTEAESEQQQALAKKQAEDKRALSEKQEAEQKELKENHRSPKAACQAIVRSLEEKGTLRNAKYTGTFADPKSKSKVLIGYAGRIEGKQMTFYFTVEEDEFLLNLFDDKFGDNIAKYWFVKGEKSQPYTFGSVPKSFRRIPDEPASTIPATAETIASDKAIADCTKAIRLDPKNIKAYCDRGRAYGKKGDYEKAVGDFTEVIRLDPKNASGYFRRGTAYQYRAFFIPGDSRQKVEYDKAITDFTEAIAIDPKSAQAYIGRGRVYGSKGEFDKAIIDFTEAVALDPKKAEAYSCRGTAYLLNKDFDKAIADCTEAVILNPKNAEAYRSRGKAYGSKGDYDKAVSDLTEAIGLDPKDAISYHSRGLIYESKGEKSKAKEDLDKAKQLGYTSG